MLTILSLENTHKMLSVGFTKILITINYFFFSIMKKKTDWYNHIN